MLRRSEEPVQQQGVERHLDDLFLKQCLDDLFFIATPQYGDSAAQLQISYLGLANRKIWGSASNLGFGEKMCLEPQVWGWPKFEICSGTAEIPIMHYLDRGI